MSPSHLLFVTGRVLRSLRELLWTHVLTAGVMAMTLFVFGGFLLIQENLGRLVRGWSDEVQVFVYLGDGVDPGAAEALRVRVAAYPEVKAVRYVSRERAWEDFRRDLGAQSGILDGLDSEVLPASLDVELRSAFRSREAVLALARRVEALEGVRDVEYPETWLEKVRALMVGVERLKWVLGGFLFLVACLIVGSTIKLAIVARRDEIEIMQLVGASDGLIKAPFVIEGMIQGLAGAGAALVLLRASFSLLTADTLAPFGALAPAERLAFLYPWQCAQLAVMGWLLGTVGSLLSVRRFLV